MTTTVPKTQTESPRPPAPRADGPSGRRVRSSVLEILSGEFVLRWRPNSGGVVLYRSLQAGMLIYLVTIGLKEVLSPGHEWSFSLYQLRSAIAETLPWLGAVFGATYAAFYTRFSQQWTYLAGLYNQIMQTDAQIATKNEEQVRLLAAWKAGFIEDAEELHLASKPMYAAVILSFLKDDGVPELYAQNTAGGEVRLAQVRARAAAALAKSDAKRRSN